MEVLKNKDQKVLLYNILERDLYLSLLLDEGDGFLAGVAKVKGVFDGLCNLFMIRVEFMKERKQPGEANSALCRRLGYLGKLANIKDVSGNDLLMMHFTACCEDKALKGDIFKIKGLTWDSLIEAVSTHEAASRMDTVTQTRDRLFKLNVSNTGISTASSSGPARTLNASSAPTLLPRSPTARTRRARTRKGKSGSRRGTRRSASRWTGSGTETVSGRVKDRVKERRDLRAGPCDVSQMLVSGTLCIRVHSPCPGPEVSFQGATQECRQRGQRSFLGQKQGGIR